MRRKIQNTGMILMAVVLCLSFSGCRPSMTFTEVIFDQNTDQMLDEAELNEVDNDPDNEDRDDSLASVARDPDSETERDRERTDPSPGEGPEDDTVPQAQKEETLMQSLPGNTPEEAGQSDTAASVPSGSSEGAGNGAGGQTSGAGAGTAADRAADGAGTGDSSGGESGGAGSGDGGSGSEGSGSGDPAGGPGQGGENPENTELTPGPEEQEQVDENGKTEEDPEEADLIAAPGEAALLVEMLAGGEKLRVSSASVTEGLAGRVFSKDWQGSVLWEEDGSSPMQDPAFSQLLEKGVEVCIVESGKMPFTDTQRAELNNRGVRIVTIPALDNSRGIREAARLVGEVTGEEEKAGDYIRFCDETLQRVRALTQPFYPDGIDYSTGEPGQDPGTGVYALYVSSWDSAASYSLYNESVVLSGTGMAVTKTGYLSSPVTEMLSVAGIGNAAALSENNYSLSTFKTRFINPILNNLYSLDVRGGSLGATYRREYILTSAGQSFLGDPDYQAVVAAARDVERGIQSSPLWQYYPYTSSASGNINGYGFRDSSGNLVESTIHGNYRVFVIPSGAGRWDRGSVESVLIPEWAAWKLRGLGSEESMRDRIAGFYREFYDYTLSGEELSEILEGRETAGY